MSELLVDIKELEQAMANPGFKSRLWAKTYYPSYTSTVHRQRSILMARHSGCCVWCGSKCILDGNPNEDLFATRDHVVRLAEGGADNLSNMVLACRKCNNTRHVEGWVPKKQEKK